MCRICPEETVLMKILDCTIFISVNRSLEFVRHQVCYGTRVGRVCEWLITKTSARCQKAAEWCKLGAP